MILMLLSIVCEYLYTSIPNFGSNVVFVIDTAINQATTSVNVEPWLYGVTITLDGTKVCFSNRKSNIISVINTKIALLYLQCLQEAVRVELQDQ